jgi:hypothetical protein
MGDFGQVSVRQRPDWFGVAFLRQLRERWPVRPSCQTLYAMQLASGVPVEREPGVCPVCGSSTCSLARNLTQRG